MMESKKQINDFSFRRIVFNHFHLDDLNVGRRSNKNYQTQSNFTFRRAHQKKNEPFVKWCVCMYERMIRINLIQTLISIQINSPLSKSIVSGALPFFAFVFKWCMWVVAVLFPPAVTGLCVWTVKRMCHNFLFWRLNFCACFLLS